MYSQIKRPEANILIAFDNHHLSQVNSTDAEYQTEKVREYVRASTSENSKRAYRSDLNHFIEWGGVIPSDVQLIAGYLVEHAEKLSIATLQRRLVSLSKAHEAQGFENPVKSEVVKATIKGIRRTHGKPQRQVAPITKERLIAMVETCEDSLKGVRDKALLLIGFAGAFRRSELVALNVEDVEDVPEGLIITINQSKTDQEGKGRRVGIPYAKGDVCPVKELQKYLAQAKITGGSIYRPMASNTSLNETRLTATSVALIVKERAKHAGLNPDKFSGHSLRAGFATSAATAGVESWSIMAQTGHRSEVMLKRYIRDGKLFVGNSLNQIF